MHKLSAVIAELREPTVFTRSDAFVGTTALTIFLLEALGPLAGYPTVTGWLYAVTGVEQGEIVVWQLVLLFVPQLVAAGAVAHSLTCSPWSRWLTVKFYAAPGLLVPEVHLRETAFGGVAGFVIWFLATLQLGQLSEARYSLIIGESFMLSLGIVVMAIAVRFKPKAQYQISDPEGRVLWVVPQAVVPTEIVLDATKFLKCVVLRARPDGYVLENIKGPLRLDAGELLLLNLGELEKITSGPVSVTSANLLKCEARLSVTIEPTPYGSLLDRLAIGHLVNNLYTKPDLQEFLRSQLGLAMDEYAGEFDAAVKSMTEKLRVDLLRSDSVVAASRLRAGRASPLHGTDASVEDMEKMQQRVTSRLHDLEEFRRKWSDARRLQEAGKRDLPEAFDRRLLAHFREELEKLPSSTPRTWNSAALMLKAARVGVLVSSVEFTEKATAAEGTLTAVTDTTTKELNVIDSRLSEERRKRREELRAPIDKILSNFEPRLLLVPRGQRLFEQLMTLRMSEWDAAIANALPAINSELDGLSAVAPSISSTTPRLRRVPTTSGPASTSTASLSDTPADEEETPAPPPTPPDSPGSKHRSDTKAPSEPTPRPDYEAFDEEPT